MFGRFSLEPRVGKCDEECGREVPISAGDLSSTCAACSFNNLKVKKRLASGFRPDVVRGPGVERRPGVYVGRGVYGRGFSLRKMAFRRTWTHRMKPKRRTTMRLRPFSHPAHIMSKYRTFISSRNGGPRLVAPRVTLVLRQ